MNGANLQREAPAASSAVKIKKDGSNMNKKKKTVAVDFAERIKAAKYERIYQALKDILKVEIKAVNGKDEIDYAATCSAIKTKARMVIDFVADLDKDGDDEK